MATPELPQLLRRLHEELGRAGPLDAESRQLLELIARDIGARPETGTPAAEHLPALERLAVRFESGHPSLAGVLRRIVDALAKAGI